MEFNMSRLTNDVADKLARYGLFGLFLYFLVSAFVSLPVFWNLAVPLFLVGLMGIGYFSTQHKMNFWMGDGERKLEGIWNAYVVCPSPSSSMLNTLFKQKITPQDIEGLYFQTWDLKNDYFEHQLQKNLQKLHIADQVDLEFVGYGDENDAKNIRGIFPNAKISFSAEKLSEHVNLIKLKNGDLFIWYEPVHQANGGDDRVYRPADGAFLIKSTNQVGAFAYYNSAKIH